jgi:hypothetical protein
MEICGLDDEVKTTLNFIYIYHELWPDKKYKILLGNSFQNEETPISKYIYTIFNNDPSIILNDNVLSDNILPSIKIPSIKKFMKNTNIYSDELEYLAFLFIIMYLEKYTDISDEVNLSKPASISTLESWFEKYPNDAELFNKFRNINIISVHNKKLIYELSIILLLANYLSMDSLINKGGFLIAYAITGKSTEEMQDIFENYSS